MTHGHLLELASRIARHGATILRKCRGIPVAGLRGYLRARKAQCDYWSRTLIRAAPSDQRGVDDPLPEWETIRPILEEISTSSILVRVSSTILHGIGKQLDIPLAIDVASQTARHFDGVVQRAIGLVAIRTDLSCSDLVAIERLGQMADRMSDLLCGALLPALNCERYLVDRDRAKDFAATFGRDPDLVRVPIQQFIKRFPHRLTSAEVAHEVEESLVACLPILVGLGRHGIGEPKGGDEKTRPAVELRVIGQSESGRTKSTTSDTLPPVPLSFPTHSFARSRRRLKESARE